MLSRLLGHVQAMYRAPILHNPERHRTLTVYGKKTLRMDSNTSWLWTNLDLEWPSITLTHQTFISWVNTSSALLLTGDNPSLSGCHRVQGKFKWSQLAEFLCFLDHRWNFWTDWFKRQMWVLWEWHGSFITMGVRKWKDVKWLEFQQITHTNKSFKGLHLLYRGTFTL